MGMTPMMRQYVEIKEKYSDCILFFRVGDFYEMFFEDAKTASRALELVLTGKDCGMEERAPMCGIPYHAAATYISRLIAQGFKVAIAEQVEDPALSKGIVKRDVIKVITPGTYVDNNLQNQNDNTYLVAILCTVKRFEAYETIGELFREATAGTLELSVTDRIWELILDTILEIAEIISADASELLSAIIDVNPKFHKFYQMYNLYAA